MTSGIAVAAGRRLQLVRKWMVAQGVDAAYVTRPVSIAYLSGVRAEPIERLMALTLRADGATLIVPALERDNAVAGVGDGDVTIESWRDGEDPYALVREALKGAGRIAIEKEHLTVKAAEALLAVTGVRETADVSAEVRRLRCTKSAAELEKLSRAAAITDEATRSIMARLRVGQSELEVAALLAADISAAGGTPAFEPLVQFGPNSALPHHTPSGRRLAAGDFVLLDFGAAFDGYRADTTRMAVAGAPSARHVETYVLVLAAHDAAIAAISAGVTGGEVDRAARDVISAGGMADHFFHRVGHGLGLEAHEEPSLDPGSTTVLEEGMVATIEPGVYITGWGGVRIEDDFVVTADGCRVLTESDRELHIVRA